MSDVPFHSQQTSCPDDCSSDTACDSVCINASRIYDSCGAKDCLADLPVFFSEENQERVENACSAKIISANVLTSTIDVEPVAFHRGFYAVDMVFYFAVTVEVNSSSCSIPSTITGISVYGKRVVLYGGDGRVKTFSSDEEVSCDTSDTDCPCRYPSSMPKASVQISSPMALSAKLRPCPKCGCSLPCECIPDCVEDFIGCPIHRASRQSVVATIGIFTITQLERNVQIMIPSYDFCVPRKECKSSTDDPCEVFSKIEFPTDSFFPPQSCSDNCDTVVPPFNCNCSN